MRDRLSGRAPLGARSSIGSSEIGENPPGQSDRVGLFAAWSDAPAGSGSPRQSRSCCAAPPAVKQSLWHWHRAKTPHGRPNQQAWLQSAHEVQELEPLGGRQRTRPSSGADEKRKQTTALVSVELAEMTLGQDGHLSDEQQSGDRHTAAQTLDPGRLQ